MGGPSRHRIWVGRVSGARIGVRNAEEKLVKAHTDLVRAKCMLWSTQMEAYGGPAQPSPTIGDAIEAGFHYLVVQCKRCQRQRAVALYNLRRDNRTQIWRLEAQFGCSECRKKQTWGRPGVILVRLSEREETASPWVSPEEDDRH